MSADPALIVQGGRLGDLVLTFPLVLSLRRQDPQRPVWIAAEDQFFRPLMPLAPQAVFFPASELAGLVRRPLDCLINLSSSPASARLAGACEAARRLGPLWREGALRMEGFWHLYRASLTHNNRHNSFHWADLYRLDLFPQAGSVRRLGQPPGGGRVGLVLGASEEAKRPGSEFWARLARRLARAGLTPVLLGGRAEAALGEEVARKADLARANFCGRLDLAATAALMRGMDLVVSPDTGPMHLADWLGVRVLNLSMGPVNARETGPLTPGQLVLRPRQSCEGCWQCRRGRLFCRDRFSPALTAGLIVDLLRDAPSAPPGFDLLEAARDQAGLYILRPLGREARDDARGSLDSFWREAFLHFSGAGGTAQEGRLPEASARLARRHPALAAALAGQLQDMLNGFKAAMRGRRPQLADGWWQAWPAMLRLFAGFSQMELQNGDYARELWQRSLERLVFLRRQLAAA